MLFIGNLTNKKFELMVRPYQIIKSLENDNVVFVQTVCGDYYRLSFENSKSLGCAMSDLRDHGRATVYCDWECLSQFIDLPCEDHDREIERGYFDYER